MELRLLNKQELEALYRSELAYDFPPSELKPLRAMLELLDRGRYEPWGLFDGEALLGYALMWLGEDPGCALLDYLGILRGKRSGGLGSALLRLLGERYGGIVAEAEAPADCSAEEEVLRRRRLDFYRRNGFRLMDYECALFGVRFCCLCRGGGEDGGAVMEAHRRIYEGRFSPEHLERYIQIPLRPGEAVRPAPAWTEEE